MLYHYTSIDSLVQIIENKSIKFNNLSVCDDLDEPESADLGKAGQYVFVSCWTRFSGESIPMWSQYSGNMQGVRIGMKKFPFKKKHFSSAEAGTELDSFLSLSKYYREEKMTFVAGQPTFIDITYSDDEEDIHPKLTTNGNVDDIMRFLRGEEGSVTISFDPMGRYKRTCWEFQKECRYKVFGLPMGLKTLMQSNPEEQERIYKEAIRRITDQTYKVPYECIFVDLDDSAIAEMEIVFGPRMTNSEEILLSAYLESKGLGSNWKKSSLRIQ